MQLQISDTWLWFCIAYGIVFITTFIMNRQSTHFYTKDSIKRKFSILDLELAATPQEIVNIITGIYKLPEEISKKSLQALRGQLQVDFFFMPAIYGAIFLLCMKISFAMKTWIGVDFFTALAWLQIIAWACDVLENLYLLHKINRQVTLTNPSRFKVYQCIELFKWGLSLTGGVCAISSILFFWLKGDYSYHALIYLTLFIIEFVIFSLTGILLVKILSGKNQSLDA
jgi:hypothetical protein